MLKVRILKRLKRFCMEVDFSCPRGGLLAIVGPSGAGKTTILRAIAGLTGIDDGLIRWGEEVWG
ncbi:MAG: ATP-binding cassette domain-containing protein, partial [Syntrophales bacterium]|nr:ATP-binding cassette domain-containing protein [Syntrophales bacterium]